LRTFARISGQETSVRVSIATAPPVDPAAWIFGISEVRNAQRAVPSPPLAADGDVEVLEEPADAGAVDTAGGGLPVGVDAVALPPQPAVSRLTASTSARVGRFTIPHG
jgi:hypothetical protein